MARVQVVAVNSYQTFLNRRHLCFAGGSQFASCCLNSEKGYVFTALENQSCSSTILVLDGGIRPHFQFIMTKGIECSCRDFFPFDSVFFADVLL